MKTNSVNVVEVKFPPAIGKVQMMGGIRSKEEAARWATENGYSTVYLLKARERVYADKLTKNVAALAKQVETKSNRLVQFSETGGGSLGDLALVAAVIAIIVLLGRCGVPW